MFWSKNFSVKKHFGSKKNFFGHTFFESKKFWSKNFDSKKFLVQKNFWIKKIGSKKILGKKNFWIKKIWVRKTGRVNPRGRIYDPHPPENSRVKILLGRS